MNRNDFINILFDNGRILTLDQIATIENSLPDFLPDDLLDDFMDTNGCTRQDAIARLMPDARDLFLDELFGCNDMLDLRDYLNNIIDFTDKPTDMQIYELYHLEKRLRG